MSHKENIRLRKAIQYAINGIDSAYDAIESKRYDEALLHCGHHAAMLRKSIDDLVREVLGETNTNGI